ncbi:MAG: tRNA pseudouridine(55) synthase TruB [Bdellovibrionales bacterium]|nr:tRNA pseudouridine(55) synthase TruB [Bdellovibrionales bacterium]
MSSKLATQLNGLLLIDKPQGVTSHDVVQAARRICGMKAVGHTGTLDPLATGLMVLLLGEGTKISQYILSGDKGYRVKVRLGVTTDTLDMTGEIQTRKEVAFSEDEIRQAVQRFEGSLELPVPLYSAIKREGKKLYELARESIPVEAPLRTMYFYGVKVLRAGKDWFEAEVFCHKGGYIRSWAMAVGEELGCGASVEELRRIVSGTHRIEDALSLEKLGHLVRQAEEEGLEALGPAYVPLKAALPLWKAVTISGRDEQLMANGQISHDLNRRLIVEKKEAGQRQKAVPIKILSSQSGNLLSILEALPEGGLKIRRIFLAPGRSSK